MMNGLIRKICQRRFSSSIQSIKGRQVLDSRGLPTVEADVTTKRGVFRAIVPSGASTGKYEALELRDGGSKFGGKGVTKAVSNINNIIGPKLVGMNVLDQFSLDKYMVQELDGSKNEYGWVKSKLGANSILAVSMAIARAGAGETEEPLYKYLANLSGNTSKDKFILPVPSFNVINGGKHAGNTLAFQEFMIMPIGAENFAQALQMASEVYQILKKIIVKEYGSDGTSVGDEGGFAPNIKDEIYALDMLVKAIDDSGYKNQIKISMDVAASEFYDNENKVYDLSFKWKSGKRCLTPADLIDLYCNLAKKYPIVSIEDPFDENDFQTWQKFYSKIGSKIQILGDDLLVTNPSRIRMAMDPMACNALLLKVNQIGSIYESIEACNLAQGNKWNVMVSHRSGETEDHFIADLVVGLMAGQIKSGAPCRSERTSKYNQLLRIEEELGDEGVYAGKLLSKENNLVKN